MPKPLSISEASRLYRISERTIRNWIHDGLLSPGKMRVNGKLQYAIEPSTLEEVMRDRNMIAIPIQSSAPEDDRIASLEKRLEAVERRLSLLETQRYAEVEYSIPDAPAPPEGTMEIRAFAVLHNLHINQIQRVIGEAEYINKAGMRRVWEKYHEVKRFRTCDNCPHESL